MKLLIYDTIYHHYKTFVRSSLVSNTTTTSTIIIIMSKFLMNGVLDVHVFIRPTPTYHSA